MYSREEGAVEMGFLNDKGSGIRDFLPQIYVPSIFRFGFPSEKIGHFIKDIRSPHCTLDRKVSHVFVS